MSGKSKQMGKKSNLSKKEKKALRAELMRQLAELGSDSDSSDSGSDSESESESESESDDERKVPAKKVIKGGKDHSIQIVEEPRSRKYIKILNLKNTLKGADKLDFEKFFNNSIPVRKKLLQDFIAVNRGAKVQEVLKITLYKLDEEGNKKLLSCGSNAHPYIVQGGDNINEKLRLNLYFGDFLDEILNEGSGWALESIDGMLFKFAKYDPLKGRSYIPLPRDIATKKAIINIQNEDDQCFKWAVLSQLHQAHENPHRLSHYKRFEEDLNFEGIEFPFKLDDLPKFERRNAGISINVFGLEWNEVSKLHNVYPLRVVDKTLKKHVNLLLLEDKATNKAHYACIKNFSRLMGDTSKNAHKKFYCYRCLHGYIREDLLKAHVNDCGNFDAVRTILPKLKDAKMQFQNHLNKLQVPFAIYADFECLTEEVEEVDDNKNSHIYQKHVPCSFAYRIVSQFPELYEPKTVLFRGKDAAAKFVQSLQSEEAAIKRIMKMEEEMDMPERKRDAYRKAATHCHICSKKLLPYREDKKNPRVIDHCHVTGKVRGVAHNNCNLPFNYKNFYIPVLFHNLKGYDSHIIMSEIGKYTTNLRCIPKNYEQYICFSMDRFKFLDSLSFMGQSLAKLAGNLGKENMFHLKSEFKHLNDEQFDLLTRKGVYPYDYVNKWSVFKEKKLPAHEKFYSTLAMSNITEEEYLHAQNVWKTLEIEDMGEYHDIYLATDVMLLADVFEQFRITCMESYGLDPLHYVTAPGLAWDAMMKMTDVTLDLFNDEQEDMHMFVERGLRGGISMISHRHAEANNKYMPEEHYDKNKDTSYLSYLDANNLYGWAMIQNLPCGNYGWSEDLAKTMTKIEKLGDDSDWGAFLEVDYEYPEALHDLHNEYPLAPEHRPVESDEMSPYVKELMIKHNIECKESEKLLCTLEDKTRYVVHYRTHLLYVSLGLKVKKVHRILTFEQSPWMKKYIDFNTAKRTVAKNEFEKDFFKLMNNSVFGKTMENVRRRVNIDFFTDEKKASKAIGRPTCKGWKEFPADLWAVEQKRPSVKLFKPVIVGAAILDLSKVLMYSYYYNTLKKRYGDNMKLLFTDTDSLCIHVKTEDIYKDMLEFKDSLDCADYPVGHILHDKKNKKVIGKFKNEFPDRELREFVGIRSKMYSVIACTPDKDGNMGKMAAKGINQAVILTGVIRHQNYLDCIFSNKKKDQIQRVTQYNLRSINHVNVAIKSTKIGLSCIDTKRFLRNNIDSYAYGHWRIENEERKAAKKIEREL
jgi:hypothetical protein